MPRRGSCGLAARWRLRCTREPSTCRRLPPPPVPRSSCSSRAADTESGLVAAALAARVRADLFLGDGLDAETAERALALEEAAPPAVVDTRIVFKLGQWLRYVDDFAGST